MTSLLRDRKVDVHILYRSKFNDRKIWAEEELSISGTEATLKHPRNDVYVMEVSERGDSKIVLTIDFRKIKSYTMRARCWHEVKYEGRLIALRFTENETFDEFYKSLERILRIYKKFTKPKNDKAFLQEVEMFQLKQLKPVENVRVDRSVSLGTTEQESPSSSGTLQGGKTRVTNPSRSLDTICQRERLPRPPDPVENKKQVKKNLPPPPQKKKTPSEADGGTSLNSLPPQTNPKPKPQRSPPIVPPPRISGDYQNDEYADPGLFETTEPAWRSDTSDEDSSDQNSSNYAAGTTYGSKDDEVFESPRPLLPARTRPSSTDSSASDPTEPSRPGDNRQRKPKPSNNREVSASPPLPPKHETRKCFKHHDPTTPSTRSPSRDKRPTTFQPPDVKRTGPPIAPNPPPKRNNDLKRQDLPPGPHPNHPLPPPPTPPFQPDQRPPQLPSSTYGMAMHWACKCTLQNDFWKMNCAACDWLRTDAWQCLDCPTVYSNDVTRCFTCDVWRCRLCTALNRGEQTEWTLCHVCNQ